ncbi:SCAN domain-containing protein 3 [Trichonephila clavipes]|nr:SCAN domain-containing protein 3 [Trichonephila clavipes]
MPPWCLQLLKEAVLNHSNFILKRAVAYLKFGFIESVSDKRLPTCLLCNRVLSAAAMKPSKLEDHLRRCHPDKRTKSGKSHTIGEELILPAVEEVLKTVIPKSASDIIQRRFDEMSQDVESFLCDYLQTTHFSLQLDESTLPGNESLLLAYICFTMDQEHHKEMFFARTLITDTNGESIFNVLKEFLIAFPSSCLVERGFSVVANLLTKKEIDWALLIEEI